MAVAKKAQEVVEVGKDLTFEYQGVEYSMPPADLWPLEVVEAQEEGRLIAVIKGLLGDQYEKKFRKPGQTLKDLDDFSEAMYKAMDLDPKE